MKLTHFITALVFCATVRAQTLETIYQWPQPGLVGDPQGPLLTHGTDYIGMTLGGGANNAGFVFKIASATGVLTKIRDFDQNAWTPKGGLIMGSDGNYYGATFAGGIGSSAGFPGSGRGTFFRLTPAGTFTVLASLLNPMGEPLEISPLVFAGVNQDIQNEFGGAVYKVDLTGPSPAVSIVKQLNAFQDGRIRTGLIKASDGKLYGSTDRVIFRVDVDGQNYEQLRKVTNVSDTSGQGYPSGVTEGADGNIYGIAQTGGNNAKGVVFRMAKDGTSYTVLHHFDGTDGDGTGTNNVPKPRLLLHTDGNFYGAMPRGGASDGGTLFKLTPAGEFTKLREFCASAPGGLAESAGNLLVTTSTYNTRGVLYNVTRTGVASVIYAFNNTLGSKPTGAPLLASDGNVYGTTADGGANDLGTFWRKKSTGEFDVLASFSTFTHPNSGLIEGSDGLFYGSTDSVVFSATKDGELVRLAGVFSDNGVVEGGDGALYCVGGGRLWRVTKAGDFASLRLFSGSDGTGGYGPPAIGDDGALYGVTNAGGADGSGTMWKFVGGVGGTFTVVRAFQATEKPYGPLVKGRDGAFYGLLFSNGIATHYRITNSGQFSTLGATTALATDGQPVQTPLVERNLGKFYMPHFFAPTVTGTERKIFEFSSSSASAFASLAASPATTIANGLLVGGISRGTDRNLYGVLPDGASNLGSLYRIVMPVSNDPLPGATTLAATNVQSLSATMNGEVTTNGTPAVVYFEYGATTAYGKRTPGVLVQPGSTLAVSANVSSLTRSAEFHFRIVAENDSGTVQGSDQSTITSSNSAPLAVTDKVPIRARELLTIFVLSNDSDPDGDTFTLDSFTQGAKGVVTRTGNNLIYTPGKLFTGSDTFTYTISDSLGAQAVGQVVVLNPFLALAGSYAPLVGDDDGLLTMKVTGGGTLSGKLKLGAKTYPLKGLIGLDGTFTQSIVRKGLPNLVITLNFTNPSQLATVTGVVDGLPVHSDTKLAQVLPAPAVAAKNTIVLHPDIGSIPATLNAYGWAKGRLSAKGVFTLTGETPERKPFSLSGKMRVDTSVVFFKTAKAPASSFVGKLTYADAADSDFSGSLRWTRGVQKKGIFLGTIDTTFTLKGCQFTPPAKLAHTLAYTTPNAAVGTLELGLAVPATQNYSVDLKDKALLIAGQPNGQLVAKITLINRADGGIEGHFKHPELSHTAKPVKFYGVQLQTAQGGTGPNKAYGHFNIPTTAGSFTFTPQ